MNDSYPTTLPDHALLGARVAAGAAAELADVVADLGTMVGTLSPEIHALAERSGADLTVLQEALQTEDALRQRLTLTAAALAVLAEILTDVTPVTETPDDAVQNAWAERLLPHLTMSAVQERFAAALDGHTLAAPGGNTGADDIELF